MGAELLALVGARLRARRLALGSSQAALASQAGVSTRFLGQVEGGRANISLLRLAELCQALDLPLAELFVERPRGARVALVGLRGAGKSTLGASMAAALGVPFVELDQRVEDDAGMTLAELFELRGEAHYRALERQALRELLQGAAGFVVAAGGSIVTSSETWQALREGARTVWLRCSPEAHLSRVQAQGDLRPMAGRGDALVELQTILREREPLYAQAHAVVDTDGPRGDTLQRLSAAVRELGVRAL